MAIDIEPTGLVPQGEQWTTQGAFYIANALFDPLVALDAEGSARPYLAKSIVPNETFTEWTITLRPGVRFHDGTPFDAAALKENLDAMRSSLTGVLLGPLESTQVTGELTAVVTLSSPWSLFPYNLARQGGYMVAPATLDDPDGTNHPIGTGPFVFDSWERGSTLTVTRNDDYWRDGLPYLDQVTFVVVDDPTSRLASVSSGTSDAAVLASAAEVRATSEEAGTGSIQFFSDRDLETDEETVLLNTTRAPFDDLNARRAVAHAIDRSALESATGRPTTVGPFQEGSPYYLDPDEAGWPAYDVAQATELAAQYEADHGQRLSFTLMTIGDSDTQAQAQVLQSQLAAAGIEMQLETVEIAATSLRLIQRDFDAVLSGFLSSPTIDQSYIFFEPPPPGGGLSVNFTGLVDPELVTGAGRGEGHRRSTGVDRAAHVRPAEDGREPRPTVHGHQRHRYGLRQRRPRHHPRDRSPTPRTRPMPARRRYRSAWRRGAAPDCLGCIAASSATLSGCPHRRTTRPGNLTTSCLLRHR